MILSSPCDHLLHIKSIAGDLRSSISVRSTDKQLFTPFGTPLAEGEGTRQAMDCFYSRDAERASRRTALLPVKARSTDLLSVYQATITALVSVLQYD